MFNTNLPAGNHVINRVTYCSVNHWTVLALCCGLTAHVDMLATAQYKPVPGDYYIVTDHGTASIIKKTVFEGATKHRIMSADMGAGDDIARLFLFDPTAFQITKIVEAASWPSAKEIVERMNSTGLFAEGKPKPETMGMREENDYVDKPKNTFVTTSEVAKSAADAVNHLLSNVDAQVWAKEFKRLNCASDEGTMLSWFACAIMTGMDEANRRRDAEEAKLQNVIKSLTAQNDKKQKRISELDRAVDASSHAIRAYQNIVASKKEASMSRVFKVIRKVRGGCVSEDVAFAITNALTDAKLL